MREMTIKRAIRYAKRRLLYIYEDYWTYKLISSISDQKRNGNSNVMVLFSDCMSMQKELIYSILAHRLFNKGIDVHFLFKKRFILRHLFKKMNIGNVSICNSLDMKRRLIEIEHKQLKHRHYKWIIDYDRNTIEANGINLYYVIMCSLRTVMKSYNINLRDASVKGIIGKMIDSCDVMLQIYFILNDYAKDNNIIVKIVGWESWYIPNGVFRIANEQLKDDTNIEFIDVALGYMHYFNKYFRDSYFTVVNYAYDKVSTRVEVKKEDIERAQGEVSYNNAQSSIMKAIERNSRIVSIRKGGSALLNKIKLFKNNNKKIFVLFAHVFYDVTLDDSSNAYSNMCEWIVDTVKYFAAKGDLLLLKPHPAERLIGESQKEPNETLSSFYENYIGKKYDNIQVLEPGVLTLEELSQYMDCGLIWRSSIAMELTYLEKPCIIAGNPQYGVLNLNYANNREDYLKMIDGIDNMNVTKEQIEEVVWYIYCLENYKHYYVDFIEYDKKNNIFKWNKSNLRKYLRNGCRNIDEMTNIILNSHSRFFSNCHIIS